MEDLHKVTDLIRLNNRKEAWDLLNKILTANAENETAWLLAYELAKPNVRKEIVRKALAYIPNSSKLAALAGKVDNEVLAQPRPRIDIDSKTLGGLQGYQTLSQRLASRGYVPPQPYSYDTQTEHVTPAQYSQNTRQTTIRNGVDYQRAKSTRNWAIGVLLLCPFCEDIWWAITVGFICALLIIVNSNEIKAYETNMGLGTKTVGWSPQVNMPSQGSGRLECPNCHSQRVQVGEESFNLGKSILGGVLIGPVGFLSGFLGKNPMVALCQICGTKWRV